MNTLISTRPRRIAWAALSFLLTFSAAIVLSWLATAGTSPPLTDGEIMKRFLVMPMLAATITLALLSACAQPPAAAVTSTLAATPSTPRPPFMAQVVGVQWLNPLQRRDYPTEWQLLWTLGLVKPNVNDDMVRTKPKKYSTLQMVASIAAGNDGSETFKGYHHKYVEALIDKFHDIYFSSSDYFYNAHSRKDKTTWRELAGIHVEYALPEDKLDPVEAATFTRQYINDLFAIGNIHFPNAWTRNTPPDVRVTMGGPNAGFTSLAAAMQYLQAHPNETVWAMNWDAPSRPKDDQLNENMVLLVLAGPHYKTGRAPLAWIGLPASKANADFTARDQMPPAALSWKATLEGTLANAGKRVPDIGFVIHDANNRLPDSGERMRHLAHVLALDVPVFDYTKQTFNTPALLGEMGAGTALTNVALGIAYANHLGKNVLVAGTSDPARTTAVLVTPPATVRPIEPDKPWFRARSGNHAYLMWWGIRHDEQVRMQGWSN